MNLANFLFSLHAETGLLTHFSTSALIALDVGAHMLENEIVVRVLAWSLSITLVAIGFWYSNRLARKIENTKDNVVHGGNLHKERLRAYALKYAGSSILRIIVPGSILMCVLYFPEIYFIDTVYITNNVDDRFVYPWLSPALFVIDQMLKGVLFDAMEVYGINIGTVSVDSQPTEIKTLVFAYRMFVNLVGVAVVVRLGSVLLDWLCLPVHLWKDNKGNFIRVNLSGISRGYTDTPLRTTLTTSGANGE